MAVVGDVDHRSARRLRVAAAAAAAARPPRVLARRRRFGASDASARDRGSADAARCMRTAE
jgi:hypothetical protein